VQAALHAQGGTRAPAVHDRLQLLPEDLRGALSQASGALAFDVAGGSSTGSDGTASVATRPRSR